MRRIFLVLLISVSIAIQTSAQVTYTATYFDSVGNPGGLNTEADFPTIFGWTSIMSGNQSTNIWTAITSIPFSFDFYGVPVTSFIVSLNGLITFDTGTGLLPNANTMLPNAVVPDQTIACFWDEFTNSPPTGFNDQIYTKVFGTAPNRQLWIRWRSLEYGNPNTGYAYFSCVLEETSHNIYMVDQHMLINNITSTVGVQNDATTAYQYGNDSIPFKYGSQVESDNSYYQFEPLIIAPPVATFTAIPVYSCNGTIVFEDQSAYNPTSWLWDFGDGDTSVIQNPSHSYSLSDTFSITLIVGNANGFDTLTKNNFVIINLTSPLPSMSCLPPTTAYCCGFGITNVTFGMINNSSGDGLEGYSDFSCFGQADMYAGASYPISIATPSPTTHNVRVWIDYNNDSSFNDTSELVFSENNTLLATGNVLIPLTAVYNTYLRMRVSAEYDLVTAPLSCTSLTYGQAEDYAIKILVNPFPPSSDFTQSDTTSCDGIINFTDLSTNIPTSWFWDFGDGNTDTVQNPTNTYIFDGTYTVTLIATNANGADTLIKTSLINVSLNSTPVSASCTPTTVAYCCGYGIFNVSFNQLNYSSGNGSEGYQDFTCTGQTNLEEGKAYTLSITTGTNLQDTKVWIDYNNDGIFTDSTEMIFESLNSISPSGSINIPTGATKYTGLRMRVSSDNAGGGGFGSCTNMIQGQVEDYTVTIIDNPDPPVTDFTALDSTTCDGVINFVDLTVNSPTTWSWNFGDSNTSTGQNPTHTYATTGLYTVTLTTINANGSDTKIKTAFIEVLSLAGGPINPVCIVTTQFGGFGMGISRVIFSDIDTATSDGQTEGYKDFSCTQKTEVVEGGTYSIQVFTGASLEEHVRAWIDYNNDGLFNSVNELVLDVDDTLFYHNGTITIPTGATTNTLIRMRIVSDAWWMPAPPSCGTVQRGQAEDYGITIIAKPVADFTIAITDTCADIITVTDISTNSNSITWDFNDGNMDSTTTVVHTYTSSYTDSMYVVTLIACNGSACDTITKTIQRYAAVANFSVTPDPAPFPWITTVNFTDESFTLINTWNWDFDDGGFSTLQNPSHNFTSVGTYNVTLDVDNGFCIGQIVQEVNVLKTGITATSKFSFKVYPNPASNYFTIVLPNNSDNITLEIFNVLGERIYAEALLKGHALMKNIDVDDLQGMYFIKISGGDYYAINKIVVR